MSVLNKNGHIARGAETSMALHLAIADDTFARRWLEGTFLRACIHNVTGEVVSVAIKGNLETSGTAVFDNRADLATLVKELQELEHSLQNG
jgi:hypothetical protein